MAPATPGTPRSSGFFHFLEDEVPIIDDSEPFEDVVGKLNEYVCRAVDTPFTYEQLRTSVVGQSLRPLISSLSEECHHPALIAALLALRWVLTNKDDDSGLNESRALACELVAWQVLTFLSEAELIDSLLYELPIVAEDKSSSSEERGAPETGESGVDRADETTGLLQPEEGGYDHLAPPKRANLSSSSETQIDLDGSPTSEDDLSHSLAGMNALEIAAVGNAKKFMSQKPVQKIVEGIWSGDIIFWESLSIHAIKKPRTYNKRVADPYTRLRVPRYQKSFQIGFFLAFLALYYAVLVERNPSHITITEAFLYIWIAAFAYDEYGELFDAGFLFYQMDFWSLWDIGIIGIGASFFVTRITGLIQQSPYTIDVSFDILSMTALFLVPRICSVMSLNPYFGSLIPVLKEMTMAFCRFLPVIVVLYLGFLTTFSMLARDRLTLSEMSWILIKVFFGSSFLGFDIAVLISPLFGYTLMLIFVCLTNILLITSLVSLVSNSLTEVMAHAREEYLFQYSIYVLESSTSRRMTYFMPPLNLLSLVCLRPLRLFMRPEDARRVRIFVLKATHLPFVALIWTYENSRRLVSYPASSPAPKYPPRILNRPVSTSQSSYDHQGHSSNIQAGRSALNRPNLLATPTRSAPDPVETTDVVLLVQKLSAQVDALTAMVAGQQED